MTVQPSLFDDAPAPMAIVQMCWSCGQPVCKVDVDAGERWSEAVLWNYVGLQAHIKAEHPHLYRGPA